MKMSWSEGQCIWLTWLTCFFQRASWSREKMLSRKMMKNPFRVLRKNTLIIIFISFPVMALVIDGYRKATLYCIVYSLTGYIGESKNEYEKVQFQRVIHHRNSALKWKERLQDSSVEFKICFLYDSSPPFVCGLKSWRINNSFWI